MTKNYHKPIIELRQSLNLLKDQEVITEKVLENLEKIITNISENIPTPEDFMKSLTNQLDDSYINNLTGKMIPCKMGRIFIKEKWFKVTVEPL